MRAPEAELEDPAQVGGEPGASPDLLAAEVAVGQTPPGPQFGPGGPEGTESGQVPPPGPDHRPGPEPVAGQFGHHHLGRGQQEDLREDPPEVGPPVARPHGQELVAALELLEGDRVPGAGCLAEERREISATGGQFLAVADPSGRGHDDAGPHDLGAPAEVEVLPHGHDGRVEATQLGEEVDADQHAPAGSEEDVPDGVVLAMVDLVGMDPVDHRSTLVGA